jgi:hypothetical protein
MPLHRLYNLVTGTYNPSSMTGTLPGGAGSATSGTAVQPGISAPRLEESVIEVLDATASVSIPTPVSAGKLLVMTPQYGAFGAIWQQSTRYQQPIPRGQYGIVMVPGKANEETAALGVATGTKAIVMYDGPIQAFVTTGPSNTTAISAGMPLTADGSGNLTYAGASPAAGTVLATAAGAMATNISTPTLLNVYVGGY